MNLANEGLEARKKEEEVNAKKRKAEEDARWEGASCPVAVVRDPTADMTMQRIENKEWTTGGTSQRTPRRRKRRRSRFSADSGCAIRCAYVF